MGGRKDVEFLLQFFLVRLTGVYIPRSVAEHRAETGGAGPAG